MTPFRFWLVGTRWANRIRIATSGRGCVPAVPCTRAAAIAAARCDSSSSSAVSSRSSPSGRWLGTIGTSSRTAGRGIDLAGYRVLVPDVPRRSVRLAEQVPGLQHDARAAAKGDMTPRPDGVVARSTFTLPDSTRRHSDNAGRIPPARARDRRGRVARIADRIDDHA